MSEPSAEAIRLLLETGAKSMAPVRIENGAMLLPIRDSKGELSWERISPLPPEFISQVVEIQNDDSFVDYVTRFAQAGRTVLFGDVHTEQLCAILDYHRPIDSIGDEDEGPSVGHCAHKAAYTFMRSDACLAWKSVSEKKLSQDELVEFIEANKSDIVSPDASTFAELVADLEVIQIRSVKRKTTLHNGCVQLSCDVEENTKSAGKLIVIPKKINVSVPIHHRGKPYELSFFLRYRMVNNEISFTLIPDRLAGIVEEATHTKIKEVAERVGYPVIYGGTRTR